MPYRHGAYLKTAGRGKGYNMKKKRMLAAVAAAAVLALGIILLWRLSASREQPSQGLDVYYFYDNPCLSCNDEGEFTDFFNEQTGDIKEHCSYTLHIYNTFSGSEDELESCLEHVGLSRDDYSDYLLVMNDSFLLGSSIQEGENLREMFWRESGLGNTPEVLEYYYRDTCKDCQAIKETMDAFFAGHPEIPAVRLNTVNPETKAAFKELMSRENVPSERIQIPYVIYQGKHYSGNAEIEEALKTF